MKTYTLQVRKLAQRDLETCPRSHSAEKQLACLKTRRSLGVESDSAQGLWAVGLEGDKMRGGKADKVPGRRCLTKREQREAWEAG